LDTGKYKEAEAHFITAQQNLIKIHQEQSRLYSAILRNMGDLYQSMTDYERAEKCYDGALNLQRKVLEKNHFVYIATLHQLAILRLKRGQYNDGKELLTEVLGKQCTLSGRNHSYVAITLSNIVYLIFGN
jgi:tetratricopeptide (TPR) repeat protein